MQCLPAVIADHSRIAAAFALVLRRMAGVGLLLLCLSALWPAQAMAQLVLSIDDVAVSEGDAGLTAIFFDVRLNSPAPPGGIGFEFSTSDGSADITDYDGTSLNRGRVNEGSRQTRIEISLFGDYDIEADETFFLNLLRATGATIGDAQAVGTILDDDSTPRRISIGDAVAAEGDALQFSIMLDKAARPGGVSFDVIVSDGTATGGADYQALPTTRITIPQGERQTDVFVASLADDLDEGEESFRFDIDNVTGAEPGALGVLGTITETAVSRPIIDIEETRIVEGDSGITPMAYRVTLSEPATQTVSVDYRSFPDGDVGAFTGRVIFRPGETVKSAIVPVAGDTRVESDLFIDVELFGAVNADLGNRYATGIVYNDDTDLTLSPTSLPDGRFGEYYDQGLTASGGRAPYTMAITAGALPPGMQLVLFGGRYYVVDRPTSGGTYHFTVTVTDSSSGPAGPFSISRAYTITIAAPTIELPPTTLPDGTLGDPYSEVLNPATGGNAPYVYALSAGALPDGLMLASDGAISGTPKESGTFDFTVTASDSSAGGPYTASQSYRLQIAALTMEPQGGEFVAFYASLYSLTFYARGAPGPYVFSVTGGTLPPGLWFEEGNLSGHPTAPGRYTFTITAQSATVASAIASETYTIDVVPVPFTFFPASLWEFAVGANYGGGGITVSGGMAPITFELAAGNLPPGLTFSAGGLFGGTPTTAGTYNATVRATDVNGQSYTRAYAIVVSQTPLLLPTTPLANARYNQFYFARLESATGGAFPYAYALTGGVLPSGMTLTSDGTLRGIPGAVGDFAFEATVTDSNSVNGPSSTTQSYRLVVLAPITVRDSTVVEGDSGETTLSVEIALDAPSAQEVRVDYATVNGSAVAPEDYQATTGTLVFAPGQTFQRLPIRVNGDVDEEPDEYFLVSLSNPVNALLNRSHAQLFIRDDDTALVLDPPTLPHGELGTRYDQSIALVGASGPYSLTVLSGALPPGLALVVSQDHHYIVGTPTATGSYTFSIGLSGGHGAHVYTITIKTPSTLVLRSVPDTLSGHQFQPISGRIDAVGGVAPYRFAITGGRLPNGVTLEAGGTLSGTPTENGSFSFTVVATDDVPGIPQTASREFAMSIAAAPLSLTPPTLPSGYLDEIYSHPLTALGGLPPYEFRLSAGALPPGVQLVSNGVIHGTPTAVGQYQFSVTASDNAQPNRSEATVAYSIDIVARPVQLDPKTLTPITGGAAFHTFFSARGGTGPYAFSVSAGALPSGLSLASHGALQGAPTAIGSFGFDVRVTDSTGATATGTFQLEVVLPIVTIDTGLPDGQVDNPYSQSVYASGGLQPYTFSVTEGALPPGLELDTRGIVIGVPTAAGSYTFTLTVADNNISFGPVTASRTYTVDIDPSGLVLGPKTLPMASTDVNYFQYFDASGGVAPYTYRVSAGALPPGMFLSFSFLSGTPSVAGTYHFSITATDRTWPVPLTVTREYVLVVELTAIEINPLVFPEAMAGRSYGQGVSARGGIRPYHYSLAAGALPPGMNLSDSGYISGTSNVAGHYTFTLRVADSAGGTASTATRDFSLTVVLPVVSIFTERLQPAAVGSNYVTVMTAYGGQAPYTYTLTAGTLPAGLQLTTQGHLLGTPEVVGSYEITITATDSSTPFGPISGSRSYTLVVEPRRLGFSPSLMPRATEGTPYSVTVQGLNGVAPYRFSVTNGTLPPGLTLSGDGIISGIPGQPPGPASFYQYYFALNITDANGVTATFLNVEIDLSRRAIGVMPRTLPAGVAGTAYHHPFTADNATAVHVFAWESGALPTGLRFDPQTATLSGIPLESGEFPFALRQTDAENHSVVYSDVLEIVSPTLTLVPDAPLDGVQATAYAQPFVASGGIAPYRYAIEAGGDSGLPPGLRLGEDGVLQGVPTTAGAFTFGIIATDSTGGRAATTRRTYAMTIAPPSIVIDPATLPKAIAGLDYAQTMTAYGGTAPYTFSIGAGALPPGLMLSAAGMLSGTPTDPGDSTFTVTATDASGVTGMRIYTLAVTLPKPAPASRVLSIAAGGTFTLDLTEGASGGPFTAATLVSLSPADAGTARILHAGVAYRLQFTPTHAFVGKATATFTLSNASATSAPTTVVFDVVPRPDPSQDAEAKRLLDAQMQATQRFANAQIDNFQQRMERMHGAGEGRGFSNGLSATTQAYCPQQVGTIPGRRCERRPDDTAANSMDQVRGKDDNAAFGVWASGMIRSGNHDGRNRAPDIDFETDGVSVGADYRVSDAFAFGGGLGYGRDESDIGDSGSRSESDAVSLALYASYSPGERGFVDALLGYQSLGFDLRRFVATNGNMVAGTRKGTQWFGSVSAGADIQKGAWQFTPYVRADVARADLDSYTEHGDPIFALAYNHLEVDTDTGNVGVRIDYRREASWGLWSPQLRLEYQHDFKGNSAQTIRYADLPTGPFYRADPNDFDRSRMMLGLGVLFNLRNDWSFKFDYRGLIGSGGDSDHGVLLNVDRKF